MASLRPDLLRRRVRKWLRVFWDIQRLDTSHGGIAASMLPLLEDLDTYLRMQDREQEGARDE